MKWSRIAVKATSVFVVCLIMASTLSFAAQAVGTKDTTAIAYKGADYGTITLSDQLSGGKKEFNIDGEVVNWYYSEVSQNSICTITPADFDGYLYVYLESYILSNGVYTPNVRDDWMFTQLLADGRSSVGWGNWAYSGEESYSTYIPSAKHPASFVFGRNTGTTPVYEDTYDYTLHSDGTLYVLRTEVYNNAGVFICRSSQPYFVKPSSVGEVSPLNCSKAYKLYSIC